MKKKSLKTFIVKNTEGKQIQIQGEDKASALNRAGMKDIKEKHTKHKSHEEKQSSKYRKHHEIEDDDNYEYED